VHNKVILIVDDEAANIELVRYAFATAGATVHGTTDPQEAMRYVFRYRPDLIVLDVMMPKTNGWDLCEKIREVCNVPVIMLTAMDRDQDVIRGLEGGADDYVTKPFRPQVLLARSKALLRRSVAGEPGGDENGADTSYDDGRLSVDAAERRVTVDGEQVRLTPKELGVLAYLIRHAGRVRTFEQILEAVWGWEYKESSDYVHVCVSRLRRKLKEPRQGPQYLVSEHGVGYRFERQQPAHDELEPPAATARGAA
jgi:DNA-binding response OmpR family regulator